jgi:hypothetical protein
MACVICRLFMNLVDVTTLMEGGTKRDLFLFEDGVFACASTEWLEVCCMYSSKLCTIPSTLTSFIPFMQA